MLEPPESSRVSSNSLSESASFFSCAAIELDGRGARGRIEGQLEIDVGIAVRLFFPGLVRVVLALPFSFPFSREMPLSAGSRRLMPLWPARLPLPLGSFGTVPRATSSLASVLSLSSKSSLSASRLNSNSLLSPPPALARFFEASEAESLPEESFPEDLGAESFDELPPLMIALLDPPKSMASSSVGTTEASFSLWPGFLALPGSRRASLSDSFFGPFFEPDLESSAVKEKMSSPEFDSERMSWSSLLVVSLGVAPARRRAP